MKIFNQGKCCLQNGGHFLGLNVLMRTTTGCTLTIFSQYDVNGTGWYRCRADSRFAPSQWETALLCNDVSHWLGANLESALKCKLMSIKYHVTWTDLWAHTHKNTVAKMSILAINSSSKLARATTAPLLCHVQNCDRIKSWFSHNWIHIFTS